MKKVLIVALLLYGMGLKAQELTELKKKIELLGDQNSRLQEKIDFCSIYEKSNDIDIKSFNTNFDLKILQCVGNSSDQTVEVVFTMKHALVHQAMTLYTGSDKPMAYGETGNSYVFKGAEFPESGSGMSGYQRFKLPTGILIKGKLIFRNVLPQTKKFTLVNGKVIFENEDGGKDRGKGVFEIRNLTINWD
ncbi:hypothetical protein [Cellulophaga sp. L1A9]|uniref:hypothetical protein n=1 Tax=Cellulophaga sp. L1A9 TaxID=2686362 RepID=UPI00131B8D5D|nr:hypothetical protein [Cellulophaga sp. L1A9]